MNTMNPLIKQLLCSREAYRRLSVDLTYEEYIEELDTFWTVTDDVAVYLLRPINSPYSGKGVMEVHILKTDDSLRSSVRVIETLKGIKAMSPLPIMSTTPTEPYKRIETLKKRLGVVEVGDHKEGYVVLEG